MTNLSFNPMTTLNTANSFLVSTDGLVQGTYFDDPAARFNLQGGLIDTGVTQPVWGGLPVALAVPGNNVGQLGPTITLATTDAEIMGWTVYNQAHSMILVPGNTAPIAVGGMSAHFVTPGSGIRLTLQADPTLINSLIAGAVNQQVSWDFTNNRLMAYNASPGALPVTILSVSTTSKIVNYDSGTGAVTWTTGSAVVVRV